MRAIATLASWLLPAIMLLVAPAAAAQQQAATPGTGLRGRYYAGIHFEKLVLTRQDAQIDFDWTMGRAASGQLVRRFRRPAPEVPAEYFSVRWAGWLYAPTTGTYVFQSTADDGMRVWIGGRTIINSWHDQSATVMTGRVQLEAGRYYPLRVEYYQADRDTRATLAWRLPSATRFQPIPTTNLYAALPPTARLLLPNQPTPSKSESEGLLRIVMRALEGDPPPPDMVVPLSKGTVVANPVPTGSGLRATYYAGPVSGAGVLSRVEPGVNVMWRGAAPAPGVPGQGFSVRWTGYLRAPETGVYILHTEWDDMHDIELANEDILRMTKYEPEFFGVQKGAPIPVDVTQRYEAGKFYAVDLAYKDVRGKVSRAVFSWLRPSELGQTVMLNQARMVAKGQALTVVPQQYLYPALPPPPPVAITSRAAPKRTPAALPKPAQKPAVATRPPTPKPVPEPVRSPANSARPALADLATLGKGATVSLPNLYFTQSTADLLPASRPVLNELTQALRQQPTLRLEIAGHTDNVGDAALNLRLSQQRARVVRRYLVQQGIDSLRLTAMGYGGSRPVADNRNPELRSRNRRVEVVVQ